MNFKNTFNLVMAILTPIFFMSVLTGTIYWAVFNQNPVVAFIECITDDSADNIATEDNTVAWYDDTRTVDDYRVEQWAEYERQLEVQRIAEENDWLGFQSHLEYCKELHHHNEAAQKQEPQEVEIQVKPEDVVETATPSVQITIHEGGKILPVDVLKNDIKIVISSIPGLPNDSNLHMLIIETMIVETRLGGVPYTYAAENYNNYGILQIREDTSHDTLKWLKRHHTDKYDAVMKYYDESMDMKNNLLKNVPFSIAMASVYYWRRCPDLSANIATIDSRAKLWKRVYNTYKGLGTPEIYIYRVSEHIV